MRGVPIALAVSLIAGCAQAATMKMYSYDPANSETRHAAGGVTFQFEKRFIFNRILALRSTMGQANAFLDPVDEKVLGVGLSSLIGENSPERDLYEVKNEAEGGDLIKAFCPGSKRAYMTFGRLRANQPLVVYVIGDNPAGGPPRLCRRLDFNFHGEWQMPKAGQPVSDRDLRRPKFPY